MTDEINYMNIDDFQELGYLQEINRCVLHPAGLALAIHKSPGVSTTMRVWDYRDDPEGMVFADGVIDQEKINTVGHEISKHVEARMALLGEVIQTTNSRSVHASQQEA